MDDCKWENMPSFKCIMLGNKNYGKTSFLKRNIIGNLLRRHLETHKIEIYPIIICTTRGPVRLNVWVSDGTETDTINPALYVKGDGCFIMLDSTSRNSLRNCYYWFSQTIRHCQEIPVIILENKVDVRQRAYPLKQLVLHKTKKLAFYQVSALANYNLTEPFLQMARILLKDDELKLIAVLPTLQQVHNIDLELRMKLTKEMIDADNLLLPPEDSDDDL